MLGERRENITTGALQIPSLGRCRWEQAVKLGKVCQCGCHETSTEDSIYLNAARLRGPLFLSSSNLHHPQMTIHAYPGQGLSLSQLVFALNEELKRVACHSS